MKVKEWFKKLLAGMGIGVGAAIPGVSGAAVAVIFKVYEAIIWAVNNIRKSFKKAIGTLIPVLLGVIIAVIPCVIVFDYALKSLYFVLICIFAGFLIGSFPGITDEVKDVKIQRKNVVQIIIGAVIVLLMGLASALIGDKANVSGLFAEMPWWFYIIIVLVGVVAAVALTVPGLSGSLILLILGFYEPLVSNTVSWSKQALIGHDWTNFPKLLGMLGFFALGVLIGVVAVSKVMKVLLAKHHDSTYFTIIGFVGASVLVLFYNWNSIAYYLTWAGVEAYKTPVLPMVIEIMIGFGSLALCGMGAYVLTRLSRKAKQEEIKEEIVENKNAN